MSKHRFFHVIINGESKVRCHHCGLIRNDVTRNGMWLYEWEKDGIVYIKKRKCINRKTI